MTDPLYSLGEEVAEMERRCCQLPMAQSGSACYYAVYRKRTSWTGSCFYLLALCAPFSLRQSCSWSSGSRPEETSNWEVYSKLSIAAAFLKLFGPGPPLGRQRINALSREVVPVVSPHMKRLFHRDSRRNVGPFGSLAFGCTVTLFFRTRDSSVGTKKSYGWMAGVRFGKISFSIS